MIWVANKYELSYYNRNCEGIPCYCELLLMPTDLVLQGNFEPFGGNYNISFYTWSVDGNTALEDVTSYFEWYFASNKFNGRDYFVARLTKLTESMCSNNCGFTIRVAVTPVDQPTNYVFANWTEAYCIADCCSLASGITITEDGVDISLGNNNNIPAIYGHSTHCGDRIITIVSYNDCYNNFDGYLYNTPSTLLPNSNTNFNFYRITNMRGKFVQRPTDIKREISYNCTLQYVEVQNQWNLQGFEYFPAWKMRDIEKQLSSKTININDGYSNRSMVFLGGQSFKLLSNCCEVYKLDTTLSECVQRQILGCVQSCENQTYQGYQLVYTLPSDGIFYSENGELVANDYEYFLDWLRTQNGISRIDLLTMSPASCDIFAIIGINGSGYIPTYFYFNGRTASDRIYGQSPELLSELCPVNPCSAPEFGSPTVTAMSCDAPEFGSPTVVIQPTESMTIYGFNNWIEDGSSMGELAGSVVRLTISFDNSTISMPEPDSVFLANEKIGSIGITGRPSSIVTLNNDNNASIPAGVQITIDEFGTILYNGEPTSGDVYGIEIFISNIYYNI